MNVMLQVPDEIAARIAASGGSLERRALEGLVAEEYRAGRIGRGELREALGFEVLNEVDGFLKQRGILDDTTLEEVLRDRQALEQLGF